MLDISHFSVAAITEAFRHLDILGNSCISTVILFPQENQGTELLVISPLNYALFKRWSMC